MNPNTQPHNNVPQQPHSRHHNHNQHELPPTHSLTLTYSHIHTPTLTLSHSLLLSPPHPTLAYNTLHTTHYTLHTAHQTPQHPNSELTGYLNLEDRFRCLALSAPLHFFFQRNGLVWAADVTQKLFNGKPLTTVLSAFRTSARALRKLVLRGMVTLTPGEFEGVAGNVTDRLQHLDISDVRRRRKKEEEGGRRRKKERDE